MKFAIVGCGVIGRIHAHVIQELKDATLAAAVDNNPQKLRAVMDDFHCDGYTDLSEALRRSDIDAVSICVPSGLHGKIAAEAARMGKHVLMEKPIDVSLEAADQTIDVCERHHVKLGVVFQHRFDTAVIALKQAVSAGALGRINFANARTCWYRDNNYYQEGWRGTLKLDGGGALINQSIHYIDLLQYIAGEVESVCGKCDTLLHRSIEGEDIGCAMLRFKSGAIGTIEGTTLAYGDRTTELNLFGETGSVRIENDKTRLFAFQNNTPPQYQSSHQDTEVLMREDVNIVPHKRQYEDFCVAIEQNRAPLVDGLEARKSLAIIQAIYRSSHTNNWETVE